MYTENHSCLEYDSDLMDRIAKDGIQEFTLLELELIDTIFMITNSSIFIEDKEKRYEYLTTQLQNLNKIIVETTGYLTLRELKYISAASVIARTHLSAISKKASIPFGIPNDIELLGELFLEK